MRLLAKFALALALLAFVPVEQFQSLVKVRTQAAPLWIDCPAPKVIDGDTIRCGAERVRLLAIDAPELHGCPRNRRCAPGNPVASKLSLKQAIATGPVRYVTVSRDKYGRAVAIVTAGEINLTCWQLQQGQAIYVRRWDDRSLIMRTCR